MGQNDFRTLKREWLKANIWAVVCSVLAVAALYACSLAFHRLVFVFCAIFLQFSLIIYFRNKMRIYIENHIYGDQ